MLNSFFKHSSTNWRLFYFFVCGTALVYLITGYYTVFILLASGLFLALLSDYYKSKGTKK